MLSVWEGDGHSCYFRRLAAGFHNLPSYQPLLSGHFIAPSATLCAKTEMWLLSVTLVSCVEGGGEKIFSVLLGRRCCTCVSVYHQTNISCAAASHRLVTV